ncbi:unnamed protein product [Linum tenue]|uniref:Secreted protein n=1 Tax=Linum tenue TaxID=586396 RepID=A0AAV0RW27_9ROSI|nr:unnamed protein product [Linum tenue]CAI0594832.1 unnamed protein product [Linum tenue]
MTTWAPVAWSAAMCIVGVFRATFSARRFSGVMWPPHAAKSISLSMHTTKAKERKGCPSFMNLPGRSRTTVFILLVFPFQLHHGSRSKVFVIYS